MYVPTLSRGVLADVSTHHEGLAAALDSESAAPTPSVPSPVTHRTAEEPTA
ncbi:hypothetical protein ABZ069_30335 [Streptomyces microflavus]|uniref:hypothetical protein n=1 Tax=Streptomyces microflavus TaxID=1919 RepID=UPI0033A85B45